MRDKPIRVILLIGIFASLGVVAYKVTENTRLAKAWELKSNPLKLLNYIPESALEVKEFHHTQVENGKKVWEVSGEEARYLKGNKEALIKKPRLVFYNKDGKTIEASGNEAQLFFTDKELERMRLHGAIKFNYDGFVLELEELVYLKATNKVVASGRVSLKGKGLELEGEGMEIALKDEKIRLLNQVKTRLEPERWGKKGA